MTSIRILIFTDFFYYLSKLQVSLIADLLLNDPARFLVHPGLDVARVRDPHAVPDPEIDLAILPRPKE